MRIMSRTSDKMEAFDALAPELRDLINYGPLSPDSVFAALAMQREHGTAMAARIIRHEIERLPLTWAGETGRAWTPERRSPL